jgi:hypothetical protein
VKVGDCGYVVLTISSDIGCACNGRARVWQDNARSGTELAGMEQESDGKLSTNKEHGQINEMSQQFKSERPPAARMNLHTSGVDARTRL